MMSAQRLGTTAHTRSHRRERSRRPWPTLKQHGMDSVDARASAAAALPLARQVRLATRNVLIVRIISTTRIARLWRGPGAGAAGFPTLSLHREIRGIDVLEDARCRRVGG